MRSPSSPHARQTPCSPHRRAARPLATLDDGRRAGFPCLAQGWAKRALAQAIAVSALLTALGPTGADAEPLSILLVVIDTLRADAVSAYGAVEGTTPQLDALAREGLLYENTYAPAPWTAPSHATLLTGLRVDQHRLGMPGRILLPDEITTLAERFQAAGYETVAVSENPSVSDAFQLLQGFELRKSSHFTDAGVSVEIDANEEVDGWLSQRKPSRPFFAFVNLIDPHQPYEIRERNRFLPQDAPRYLIASRSPRPNKLSCAALPAPRELAIQRGLYHGDVHAADAKLGAILRAVRARGGADRLLVLVTSDHGEYLGEDRMMGHLYGLNDAVLRVPLVVHGLAGSTPGKVEKMVSLADVAPSLLAWAGLPLPEDLPGAALPSRGGDEEPGERPVFAAYSDAGPWVPERWYEVTRKAAPPGAKQVDPFDPEVNRARCTKSDPVWGSMATWIEYPYKLRWFERYPPMLFDLSWDPKERSNQAAYRPELVEKFTQQLEPLIRAAGLTKESRPQAEPVPEDAARALEALGYID